MIAERVALVTSTPLGRIAALRLAAMGYRVVLSYRKSLADAEACVKKAGEHGRSACVVQADTDTDSGRRAAIETALSRFGRLDVLVNAVGDFCRKRRPFSDYAVGDIEHLITNNLTSAILFDLAALPHMISNRWGRIIHFGFSGVAGGPAWPHRAVYAAAKSGLMSFTRTLAAEEAQHGVTVNMVCPAEIRGAAKSDLIQDARGKEDPENPGVRPGSGEDAARVVGFLCDDDSDYITGTVIDVSGGLDPIRTLSTRQIPPGP